MNYFIDVAVSAQRDLADAFDYIDLNLKNPSAADKLVAIAWKKFRSLDPFPQRFSLVNDPFLSALGIRLIPVQNYLAFYKVDSSTQTVHILRFLYGHSDWQAEHSPRPFAGENFYPVIFSLMKFAHLSSIFAPKQPILLAPKPVLCYSMHIYNGWEECIMRHAGTQEIETPRLLLRRLMPSDAPMMYANWANDPEVTRWLRWTPHKDVAETQELLSAWALLYPNEDYYQWAIVEKATGQVFGSISVFTSSSVEPDRDPWPGFDHSNGVWEVGYCIGRAWWGKGCTTEALKALVEYWFKNTDSNWLACSHAVENPASGKVMMKAGFVYDHEAVYHKFDGTAIPCKCYALTREYYKKQPLRQR